MAYTALAFVINVHSFIWQAWECLLPIMPWSTGGSASNPGGGGRGWDIRGTRTTGPGPRELAKGLTVRRVRKRIKVFGQETGRVGLEFGFRERSWLGIIRVLIYSYEDGITEGAASQTSVCLRITGELARAQIPAPRDLDSVGLGAAENTDH